MLEAQGYKMFKGTAKIVPHTKSVEPFELYGTWLYKPETGCWYIKGQSYVEEIVQDFKED